MTDSHRDKILTFLELFDFPAQIKGMVSVVVGPLRKEMEAMSGGPLPEKEERFLERFEGAFRERLPEVLPAAVEILARRFTENDIDAMLAFYQTPTGRKLIPAGVPFAGEVGEWTEKWRLSVQDSVGPELAKILCPVQEQNDVAG